MHFSIFSVVSSLNRSICKSNLQRKAKEVNTAEEHKLQSSLRSYRRHVKYSEQAEKAADIKIK